MSSNNHPLPSPPGQPHSKAHERSRSISFRSDKSHKSSGSYQETTAEKQAKRLHTKADPTLAMSEAEPGVIQATEKSSLAPLRGLQHKDGLGNLISDPDRSNPTRSRWERPLDTIRSFEAAIDGGHSNRRSIYRSDTDSPANWDRRGSFYGNGGRYPQDSSHAGRPQPSPRSELNQYDMRQANTPRDSYYESQQGGYFGGQNGGYSPTTPNPGRQRYNRMAPESQPGSHRQPDPYGHPNPNNHRSYETVASASGSGSFGDPAGYQTDLTSSDNSSIERMQPPQKRQQEPMNDYGLGFSQSQTYQPSAFTLSGSGSNAPGYPNGGGYDYGNGGSLPQAAGKPNTLSKTATSASNAGVSQRPPPGEKRKSWFGRRFSKQS